MISILVVDDEKSMAEALKDNLEFEGYRVDVAHGGRQAVDCVKGARYHLVLLDVMMPDLDGFAALKEIRRIDPDLPVIFLTARASEAEKVKGFGLGGDDYVTKPFSIKELMARVKAVLKRHTPGSELKTFRLGSATIDLDRMTVERDGETHDICRYEAGILRLLVSKPGQVFSRDEILARIWGAEAYPSNRTVDNYIVRLRKKIESDPEKPAILISVYGAGYKIDSGAGGERSEVRW